MLRHAEARHGPRRHKSQMKVIIRQTNITMENGPFEDVFPIENWGYSSQLC